MTIHCHHKTRNNSIVAADDEYICDVNYGSENFNTKETKIRDSNNDDNQLILRVIVTLVKRKIKLYMLRFRSCIIYLPCLSNIDIQT